MSKSRQQGFTLIEAAVAIAVVAILSGIIVPLVVKNLGDSQIARAKNDVQVIAAAIASQIKDTGSRPTQVAGVADGQQTWASGATVSATAITGLTLTTTNTFSLLFAPAASNATANSYFGTTIGAEFSYKGPYLATDVCEKSDPWGSPYVILGYSATNAGTNGPIWVLSAGPNKKVGTANTATSTTWAITGATGTDSADDIVVRVN